MAKKTKRALEVEHHKISVPGIYSNAIGIGYSDNEVVVNFGLATPSYFEPHDDENVPVARIVLPWETAEDLLQTLKDVCEEHKKPRKPKRKAIRKVKGDSAQ